MVMDKEATTEDRDDYTQTLSKYILDTVRRCRNCNYCFSACPLRVSTRGFQTQGPSGILQALYYGVRWNELGGEAGQELCEILYNCTTCNSCVNTCKDKSAGMPLLEVFEKGRNLLVEKMLGPLEEQRSVLASIQRYGNPYQRPASERMPWLAQESVTPLPDEKAEVLLFVGCTASYEPDLFPLGRAMIRIMNYLEVDFGVLAEETCCADPVCRIGDKLLFEALAEENQRRFQATGAKTLVTFSPHCMNAFLKDYEGLEDSFVIRHYTEFLLDRLKARKPEFKVSLNRTVTYHDPCYLSKHNNILEPPREILRMIPGVNLLEMKDSRRQSLCCGAGGGRMYAEVEETTRLANIRVGQAMDVGAELLATACPYCHVMLSNAVKDLGLEDKIKVMDVAEILAWSLRIEP